MGMSIEKATLISIFVESTFYGLFLCLYVISNVVLFRGRKHSKLNAPLIIITFAMLCISTLNTGNDVRRLLDAFLDPDRPAAAYLQVVNSPSYLILTAANMVQTLLCDGFLMYRLYLVWGSNWLIVIVPFLSYISSMVAGFGFIHAASTATTFTPIFITSLHEWILGFTVSTLITNTMCTFLIAGKIWWIHRRSASLNRIGGKSLTTPMVLIIESGAIYSFSLSVQIGLYTSGSFAHYIVFNSMPNIIAIAFTLLIVRLGLGLSAYGNGRSTDRSAQFKSVVSILDNPDSPNRVRFPRHTCQCDHHGMDMRPLEIQVSKRTDQLMDSNDFISNTSTMGKEGALAQCDSPIVGHNDANV